MGGENEQLLRPRIAPASKGKLLSIMVMAAAVAAAVVVVLVYGPSGRQRMSPVNPRVMCDTNLLMLRRAIDAFARDNHGTMPQDEEALLASGYVDPRWLLCPSRASAARTPGGVNEPDYLYIRAGLQWSTDGRVIVYIENPDNHQDGRAAIIYSDGHIVEAMPAELVVIIDRLLAPDTAASRTRDAHVAGISEDKRSWRGLLDRTRLQSAATRTTR